MPDFATYVDDVTIHPYMGAVARLRTMYGYLGQLGIPTTVPVWVTEYGIATADGLKLENDYGLPVDLACARAAAAVRPAVEAIVAEIHNLTAFCWYVDIDQRDMRRPCARREPDLSSSDPAVVTAAKATLASLAKREFWFGTIERAASPPRGRTRRSARARLP